ncbi:MAG: ComEC/Rec2 family competence protein [Puniceicoccales bacterium]
MVKSSTEGFESRRAPLFLVLIPFGLGLLVNHIFPLAQTTTPVLLSLLLLLLLFGFSSRLRGYSWHLIFSVVLFSLGGLYGARFSPPLLPQDDHHPAPPREESIRVDPIQNFVAPPYSDSQIGLGQMEGERDLLYYNTPAGGQSEPLPSGFWVEIYGVQRDLDELIPDPGFRQYLMNRGVTRGIDSLKQAEIVGLANLQHATFSQLLQESKSTLASGSSPLDPSTRIYQALVLGQRLGLDREQKEIFRDTGTAHLFAISGLHVGLVGGFLFFFFRQIGVNRPVQIAGTLVILLFYVLLTGATPSAVRAFLMITFLVGAKIVHRAYCPTSALAASALVVLLIDPSQLFTLGFQLSYTVVLSILVFGAPLAQLLLESTDPEYWLPGQSGSPFHRLRRWAFASFSISLAAFFGSAALIIDHFQILPLSSILLNLILILPATGVLLLGFVSLVCGLLGALWISTPLNWIAGLLIRTMTEIVSLTADVPASAIPISFSNNWAGPAGVLLFLGITFWTANQPRFRVRYLSLPAASLLLTILLGVTL